MSEKEKIFLKVMNVDNLKHEKEQNTISSSYKFRTFSL